MLYTFPVQGILAAILLLLLSGGSSDAPEAQARKLFGQFATGYSKLNIPEFTFDYRSNFRNIPYLKDIQAQQKFFEEYRKAIQEIDRKRLQPDTRLQLDHLAYEVDLNLGRAALEEKFRKRNITEIPETGLTALPDGREWYRFYSRYYTGQPLTRDAWMAFGQQEVKRVQQEIRRVRIKMGYASDSTGFYTYLQGPEFLLTDQQDIEKQYQAIQKTVLKNLEKLFHQTNVPEVAIRIWPDAGPHTPPAYYNPGNAERNEPAVFHYNFSGKQHNLRAMDWMFLHEGIPGHHYQFSLRNQGEGPAFRELFYYPAVTEGWAAYTENLGKNLGLCQTPARELGKWEWDLVRSVRVVLDAGIHGQGWTKKQALAYWKEKVPGQEEIAEREVTRCLNWPGQVLSYKAGERQVKDLIAKQEKQDGKNFSLKDFHAEYLRLGMMPPVVLEKAMLEKKTKQNGEF